jgi:hypothetical protein
MVQVSRAAQPAAGGEPRCAPGSLPTNDPRAHPAYHGQPPGRPGHCPTTSHDDGQVQTDTSAGPAQPAPASSARLRLGQTTSRSWTQRATTPTPAIPAVRRPAPPPRCMTSLRPDTADAGTHGHRTPDTGHRTADTWTLRRPHRTLDTGRLDRHAWTLVARTGHWTPDAGRGHRQGDEGTAGSRTSWATTPSDRALGRPNRVPVDGACGAPQPMEARR